MTDNITIPSSIPVHTVLLSRLGDGVFEVKMKLKCSRCKEDKDPKEFHRANSTKRSYSYYCKSCKTKLSEVYNVNNRDIAREKRRAKLEVCRGYWKKHYRNNKDKKKGRNKKWREANKHKIKAHRLLRKAMLNGDLLKEPCSRCNDPNAKAHHEDYSKPLDVIWLCSKHHSDRHMELDAIRTKQEGAKNE